MAGIHRRELLQLLGSAPLAAGIVWTETAALEASRRAQQARQAAAPFTPQFFTADEYAAVVLLADVIIPADERSPIAVESSPSAVDTTPTATVRSPDASESVPMAVLSSPVAVAS